MKRAFYIALLASSLATRAAAAGDENVPTPAPEEDSPIPPPLATPTPDEDPPDPPLRPDDPRSHVMFRAALLGAYRYVQDLSGFGGGAAVSVGGDYRMSGHFNLRAIDGRTLGGLHTLEIGAWGSWEFLIAGGASLGFGVGLAGFDVRRATNGNHILSVGPEGSLRLGYQLATHNAPYFALDVLGQLQNGGAVSGATLAVGYRF